MLNVTNQGNANEITMKYHLTTVRMVVLKKTREPGIGGVLVTHTLTPSLTHSFWARLVSSLTVRSKLSFSICDG